MGTYRLTTPPLNSHHMDSIAFCGRDHKGGGWLA